MTSQAERPIPRWRYGTPGQGSGTNLLHLRDEADLAFVFEVVVDFLLCRTAERLAAGVQGYSIKPTGPAGGLVFLTDWDLCPMQLGPMWSALRARPQEGAGIRLSETEDQKRIGFVDAQLEQPPALQQLLVAPSLAGWIFVNNAQAIEEPVPSFSLSYVLSKDRKSRKRSPYLCSVLVASYSAGGAALLTQLSPKWWSMHPAYEIIRQARRASGAT